MWTDKSSNPVQQSSLESSPMIRDDPNRKLGTNSANSFHSIEIVCAKIGPLIIVEWVLVWEVATVASYLCKQLTTL